MSQNKFKARKTTKKQNKQCKQLRWSKSKIFFTVIVSILFSLLIGNVYLCSKLPGCIPKKIFNVIPLVSSINQYAAQYLSTNTKGTGIDIFIGRSDTLYSSESYIDTKNNVIIRYRDKNIPDNVYDMAIEAEMNFDWESSVITGPNRMLVPVLQIEAEFYLDTDIEIQSQSAKSYTLFSSKGPDLPPLPSSVASDYILRPLLTFRNPRSPDPYRIWHLVESAEVLRTRDHYTLEDIRTIIQNTVTGINLAWKAGYYVKDFEKFEIFAVTSVPVGGSGECGEITGARIFDNGNFIESRHRPNYNDLNYLLDFERFLMNTIGQFSLCKGLVIDGKMPEVQNEQLSRKITDFYHLISNPVKTLIYDISYLVDQPFIKDKSTHIPSLYDEGHKGKDYGILKVRYPIQ